MKEARVEPLGLSIIILIYFALKPIYLASSGSVQVADLFFALSVLFVIIKNKGRIVFNKNNAVIIGYFCLLIIYQIVINGIWSFVTGDFSMNVNDLYYVFNMLAFATVIYISQELSIASIKRAIGIGSLFAVIITAIGLIIFSNDEVRSVGFFNNPNQLGYFSVIMLTVIALCKEEMKKSHIMIVFVLSFWAVLVSLSKAAILAYFVEIIVLVLFYQNNFSVKRIVFELVVILIVSLGVYLLFFSNNSVIVSNPLLFEIRERIINMSNENDSSLAYGRGYARVGEMASHIIWGTGEGAYDRFDIRHGVEVHSTFVSLLTCYGLIGLLGYLTLIKNAMGKGSAFWNSLFVLSGLLLYSITHNGIRNTLFWILLALIYVNNKNNIPIIDMNNNFIGRFINDH